jgi:NADH-quinone oxidoreductase subunit L
MTENNLLSLIIFAPLVGAVINWIIGGRLRNELFSGAVACGTIAVSCIAAFYVAFVADGGAMFAAKPALDHLWTWIQVGNFRADFGLGMDHLSAIYACFITFVGLLIHIFATGYMHGDKGFYRFFAYLNLFMFSMLTLILADNFLLMFVGWEGVGLCSYLLIGYYIDKDESRKAAKKAFVANRIGDWGVIMAMFLLYSLTGSISFYDKVVDGEKVNSALNIMAMLPSDPLTWGAIVAGGVTSVAVLLFIGACGKSAQIPLYVWLPDAMAGPTPVSALIHAATMVTAGVYMVVRCNGIYQNAPTAMLIVALIGAFTAIVAATIGLAQNDIKKVLAYSTVSQLGYMFLACGVGAFIAAIFHVMTHAFFKALLFLGSGSVIHGMRHEQDMRKMGALKKYMPITFFTMAMGWLAICGIPIWAGFFSKDEILYRTFAATNATAEATVLGIHVNTVLWVVGLITAVLTAVYMTRMMWMTFFGESRFHGEETEVHAYSDHSDDYHDSDNDDNDDHAHHALPHDFKPHESPWLMTLPLVILAILSIGGGLIGIPYAMSSLFGMGDVNAFEHILEPVIAKKGAGRELHGPAEVKHFYQAAKPVAEHSTEIKAEKIAESKTGEHTEHNAEEISTERWLALLSVVLALSGIGIGIALFGKTPLRQMPKLLENKYFVDEFYNKYIIDPIANFSREGLWKGFDVGFIDGMVNGIGSLVTAFSGLAKIAQTGFVRSYAAMIVFGALVILGYFIYYGLKLVG